MEGGFVLTVLSNRGIILDSANEAVHVAFKDWMTSIKRERKKKINPNPPTTKKLRAENIFFGTETEAYMAQRMSSSSDANSWLLLNTLGCIGIGTLSKERFWNTSILHSF